MDNLERILAKVKENEKKLDRINWLQNYEHKVTRAIFAEIVQRNLQGNEARNHYNKWMKAAGLKHLIAI